MLLNLNYSNNKTFLFKLLYFNDKVKRAVIIVSKNKIFEIHLPFFLSFEKDRFELLRLNKSRITSEDPMLRICVSSIQAIAVHASCEFIVISVQDP